MSGVARPRAARTWRFGALSLILGFSILSPGCGLFGSPAICSGLVAGDAVDIVIDRFAPVEPSQLVRCGPDFGLEVGTRLRTVISRLRHRNWDYRAVWEHFARVQRCPILRVGGPYGSCLGECE
jgi:hypothetical protein